MALTAFSTLSFERDSAMLVVRDPSGNGVASCMHVVKVKVHTARDMIGLLAPRRARAICSARNRPGERSPSFVP